MIHRKNTYFSCFHATCPPAAATMMHGLCRVCPCFGFRFRGQQEHGYDTIATTTYQSTADAPYGSTSILFPKSNKGGGAAIAASDSAATPVHPAIALPRYVMDEEIEVVLRFPGSFLSSCVASSCLYFFPLIHSPFPPSFLPPYLLPTYQSDASDAPLRLTSSTGATIVVGVETSSVLRVRLESGPSFSTC